MSDSRKNYDDYIHGKDELRHAVLQFSDTANDIFDFIKKNTRRAMWVMPVEKWREYQDKLKKNKSGNE